MKEGITCVMVYMLSLPSTLAYVSQSLTPHNEI